MKPLSAKQLELFDTIRSFADSEGRMPSVRELASRLGRAPSTIQQHLDALTQKGLIGKDGSAHGMRLTIPNEDKSDNDAVEVLIRGTIAAGTPIEAIDLPEDPLFLPSSLAPPGSYALKVRGNSMVDSHILDGDLVLIREQSNVENGAIAVALLPDGSATLKKIYKEAGKIRLQPANPSMSSTWVDSVAIQGKVVGVFRRI